MPDVTAHPKWEVLILVSDVRKICNGNPYPPPNQEAYDCLDKFKEVLRESKLKPTDDELRDNVELLYQSLIIAVQQPVY
jgi:hypothetical protein